MYPPRQNNFDAFHFAFTDYSAKICCRCNIVGVLVVLLRLSGREAAKSIPQARGQPASAAATPVDGRPVFAVAPSLRQARRHGILQRENPDFLFAAFNANEALARHFASGDLFLFQALAKPSAT